MKKENCPKIDESRYNKENHEFLLKKLAYYKEITIGNPADEMKVKRLVNIDFAIIFLLYEAGYYGESFHFWEREYISEKLRQFRPDLNVTDEEIIDSLKRSKDNFRLYCHSFRNGNIDITKWKYNESYTQNPEKPPYTPPSSGEKNPFLSEEYKKLKDELDNL